MSDRPRCRTLLTAGALLVLGTGLPTPEAQAAPNFPLGGGPGESAPDGHVEPHDRFEQAPEKAERLGGGTVNKLLDLGTEFGTNLGTEMIQLGRDAIKCVLNIASPEIPCEM